MLRVSQPAIAASFDAVPQRSLLLLIFPRDRALWRWGDFDIEFNENPVFGFIGILATHLRCEIRLARKFRIRLPRVQYNDETFIRTEKMTYILLSTDDANIINTDLIARRSYMLSHSQEY